MWRQFLSGLEACCGRVFLLMCWLLLGQPSAALAADGDLVWERYVTSNLTASQIRPESVSRDAAGNAFMVGSFRGTFDFDPGPGTTFFSTAPFAGPRYDTDAFVVKLDASGQFVWARRMGGENDDEGYSVAVDNNGDVLLAGAYYGPTTLTGGPVATDFTNLGDLCSAVVVKLSGSGDFLWYWSMGGLAHSGLVAVDNSGNVFLAGSLFAVDGLTPAPGIPPFDTKGGKDIFVLKLDSFGKFLWAKNFGGLQTHYVHGMTVDGDGNVYLAGEFGDAIEFDSDLSETLLASPYSAAAFLVKYDASGGFVWARAMGGPSRSTTRARGVAVDGNGNVFLAGCFYGPVDFAPAQNSARLTSSRDGNDFVLKLDASGNFQWVRGMGRSSGTLANKVSMGLDAYGNVFMVGGFKDTADFDPGPNTSTLNSAGSGDAYVLKLDPLGDFVWAKQIGGIGDDFSAGISVDSCGRVFVAGYFDSTIQLFPWQQPQGTTSDRERGAFMVMLEGTAGLPRDQLVSCLVFLIVLFMGILRVRRAAKVMATRED